MKTYYHFSLDSKGKVETLNHNSKLHTDETLQEWFDTLVTNNVIDIDKRVEGYIEIVGFNMLVEYRNYHDIDNNDYTEIEKNVKIPS